MFIVLEIQTDANGKISTLVTQHETSDEAESKYHSVLSYAAVSNLPMHSAVIMRPDGVSIRSQHYMHKTTE